MCLTIWKPAFILACLVVFSLHSSPAYAQAPTITNMSPYSGPVGSAVTIVGSGFGATQGTSTVTLGGTNAFITSWSDLAINAIVPTGASSGSFTVTANNQNASTPSFTVTSLPQGWSDGDVGSVGVAGSATYANGAFTVKGSGQGIYGTSDAMNFAYQPWSGDGTVVARVTSITGTSAQVGVMIRETLNANSSNAFTADYYSYTYLFDRLSTGGTTTQQTNDLVVHLPYWVKVVRSGNTFTHYQCTDGMSWVQVGSSQTITMAQSVYVGLAVTSDVTSSLATATFDSVSLSSASSPAPLITSLSATTGSVGSQLLISGSGFGSPDGTGSVVYLNGSIMPIDFWNPTSIVIIIPSGATSGPVVVSVGPSMNTSNPVQFVVTPQPLPTQWLDQDVGGVGLVGSATYTGGIFTVKGSGTGVVLNGAADQIHFGYQPFSGDGTIVARVASSTGTLTEAGPMIRETLNAGSSVAYATYYDGGVYFIYRASTGAGASYQYLTGLSLPLWIKLIRSGSAFGTYESTDGQNWVQVGTTQTISMAQNVYGGLAVSSTSNSSLGTASFDDVSISSNAAPAPVITSVSATTGSIGSQVVISGSGFGSSQGSAVLLNDLPMTINFWNNTSITFTIPSGATSGSLVVSVAPTMNDSNPIDFIVTSQPLPTPWLDDDFGAVGVDGSATYASGTFTVKGSGAGITGTSDGMHFAYQPLSGDGTIVARIVSNSANAQSGVMIRETPSPGSTNALTAYYGSYTELFYRATTGGSTTQQANYVSATLPYWLKLTRSGNTFAAYQSTDGQNWAQVGSNQTITMAQNVYVGLAVSSVNNSSLATATFDNVSITQGLTPLVTGVSPTQGTAGTPVTISGVSFGASQGTSTITFNGISAASVTGWNNTQIVATVPSTIPTGPGPVVVTVGSVQSNTNVMFTAINPVITNLQPPAAELGSHITINGSGFGYLQGGSQVQFTGGQTGGVISWSDTAIVVEVPEGITTGPVTVIEDAFISNGVQFTVLGQPSVTSISPTSGPVGTSVTINGANFGATQSNSTATFDEVAATVTSWSNTQIVAVVPSGASTGAVNVTVGNVTAYGPTFVVNTGVTLTDSLGHQSSYTSLIAGGKWYASNSQGSGCSSCTLRGNIINQYDSRGNITSTTDELGNVTSSSYDANNNVTSMTQPAVSGGTPTTTYTYNSFGEVLTMTDPLGHITTNTYDSHGNLTSVTTPAPGGGGSASVTRFAYNSLGELTQITDPLNHVTTMTYTTAGLIATITDAQNHVTTYGYDLRGNRTSVTDALNHQTTFAYDLGNRLTGITYPDSSTAMFTYDYRGRRITATDQNGKATTYAYDDADRLISVTDAANNVTQYTYDTENNLVTITDANNHATTFAYDAFGRVTQTTFPSNLFETYAYDADNNLTSKTDRKGQTINYVYDALNRMTQKNYPDSTNAEYAYDLVGKILQVNDPTGTYGFSYDNMGRLIGTSTQYSFLTGTFTNAYSYDAASNRTGYTAPDGSTNTYSYDTLNRLSTLANSWAGSFGFTYDALSRRTQMTRPNSVATNYTYDNLSRLLSVLHQVGGSTIDGATYALDAAGNRTAKTDQLANVMTSYTYDPTYQLLQATQGVSTTESYTYDPVGNRLSSLGASSYSVNSSNEVTAAGGVMYTYDYNGNTTSKIDSSGTTNYAWDYENRLTQVTLPGSGGTLSFKYDPFGRRIYKSSSSGTSIYAYDDDGNLVEEMNASGGVVARYAQGLVIDEPLATLRSGTTSYYQVDGNDNVTSLSNTAGSLAQAYTFDSFGNQTASSGSLTNLFRYTGRELDTETGVYYYRARYYDPVVGHFMSEDEVGNDEGANLYRYVGNSPIDLRDPTGFYKLFGFSVDQTNQMNNAIQQAIDKLSEKCPNCAGPAAPRIIHALKTATYIYAPDITDCGRSLSRPAYDRHITVGGPNFRGGCCTLASTLAHEASHLGAGFDEPQAYKLEKDCFNCGSGHPPK